MSIFRNLFRRSATTSKKKEKLKKPARFLEETYVPVLLTDGEFTKFVVLPKYISSVDWIVDHAFEFFHNINLYFSTVSDFCTTASCPVLDCGSSLEFASFDPSPLGKKSKLSAAQYVDSAMTWISHQLDDETLFPVKADHPYPTKRLMPVVAHIFRLLYRVLAHIYFSHFEHVVLLKEEAHLNTLFLHFLTFGLTFQLLDVKELLPMRSLLLKFNLQPFPI